MSKRFDDNWNRAIDGADGPQDGLLPQDIERLLIPGAHDYPVNGKVYVVADCKDQEVLIERGKESVIIKASEIDGVVAMLLKAKDLFLENK
jgi:hypothetical protein